jgi:hypothetical protein
LSRLFVSISHHGLGHLAQTAPLLHALRADRPETDLVVQSALPAERLQARLPEGFIHHPHAAETAFVMHDALCVDVAASRIAFARFHADLPQRVDALAQTLDRLKVDAVFSDVAYLPLLAAARTGRQAWACCSLNWADIYAHYLGEDAFHAEMCAAYAGAHTFFRPTPAMAMPWLGNTCAVGPLAQHGRARREEMAAALAIDSTAYWCLVAMGGFGWQAPAALLPGDARVIWLVPDDWPICGPRWRHFNAAGMAFRDVLASCDGLFTKPGYGSFVEATTQGLDVLYLPRLDWPEAPALTAWLHAHARAAAVDLHAGGVAAALAEIEAQPLRTPPKADGVQAVISIVAPALSPAR